MAQWSEAQWEPALGQGLARDARRGGRYRCYLPDPLVARHIEIDGALSRSIAEAEQAIRRLDGPQAGVLANVARFLLRSEAIASSQIEGVSPSPKQVALAELGKTETVLGISEQAQLVANNLTVVHEASITLATVPDVTLAHVEALHQALLPDQPHLHGIRTKQNWIGGHHHHPLDADFVPPPADQVPGLMSDLLTYLNGAAHSPVVQAALVHAQFETIHPFADGNGRVGRALIHTVLTRRGLTPTAVLPVSLVLSTWRNSYVEGLGSYRYTGPAQEPSAVEGVRQWITLMTQACLAAAQQSQTIIQEVDQLRDQWAEQVAQVRRSQQVRPTPRAGSATSLLLAILPSAPVLTGKTAVRILGISAKAALEGLQELQAAGILHPKAIGRGATAYLAEDLLNLVTFAERRLASTHFDTRLSAPNYPVPALPQK